MVDKVRLLTTEQALWDRFVAQNTGGATFCHLAAWKQIIEDTYHLPCYYLYCQHEGGVSGVLPMVHMRGILAPNRLVSVPFLDQGGIIASDERAFRQLLEAGLQLARSVGARGLDLRDSFPAAENSAKPSRRYRFVVKLPETSDRLWQSLSSKVRNQIRKAEKSGLETQVTSPGELSSFFDVFARNMRDLGSPTHSEKFFRLMADALDGQFALYLTRIANQSVVAGAIAIRFADTVTVPWASAQRSARSQCPNHSLYWKILQDSIEDGATEFDFGRSTEGSGTFRFKKQWNTELRQLAWRFLTLDGQEEQDYLLGSSKNSILTRTWSALPAPVANTVGPWIRRQLPN